MTERERERERERGGFGLAVRESMAIGKRQGADRCPILKL